MLEEGRVSAIGAGALTGLIGTSVSGDPRRYPVPRATGEVHASIAPVVAASVDEKVSDLIQAYPHLKPFLKSHAHDANARIRDLAISGPERDQLLNQIIAARRQQVLTLGETGSASHSLRRSQPRFSFYRARRGKPAQEWPKRASRSSPTSLLTGKWHKQHWG